MNRTLLFFLVVVILLIFIGFIPYVAFWSIVVLFNYYIPLTFKTWFAALVLIGLLNSSGARSK